MSNGNQEQERLKRLREKQLQDRDPHVKQRQFQRISAQREKKYNKPHSLKRMWSDITYAWKGFFYGIVLGTLVLLIVPLFWIFPWAEPFSVSTIIVFAIIGVIIGRAIDAREELKNLMR